MSVDGILYVLSLSGPILSINKIIGEEKSIRLEHYLIKTFQKLKKHICFQASLGFRYL